MSDANESKIHPLHFLPLPLVLEVGPARVEQLQEVAYAIVGGTGQGQVKDVHLVTVLK